MDLLRNPFRALRLIDTKSRRWLVVLAACGVALALLDLAGLLLLAPLLGLLGGGDSANAAGSFFADLVGGDTQADLAVRLALLAAGVFLVKGILAVIVIRAQTNALATAQVRLAARLLSAFTRANRLVQQATSTGGFMRTSIPSVQGTSLAISSFLTGLSDAAVFLAVVAAVAIIDPWLALGSLIFLGLIGLAYVKAVKETLLTRGRTLQVEGEQMNATLLDLVGGIREMTIRGTSATYGKRVLVAFRSYLKASNTVTVTNLGMRYFLESLTIAGIAVLIILTALFADSFENAIVSIGVLLAGTIRILPALNTFLISVNNIRASSPAIAFVGEELSRLSGPEPVDNTSELVDSASATSQASAADVLAFHGVSFRYPGAQKDAVCSLTFSVAQGESIGIVGASGAGKSTLMDLVLGLLTPDTGDIYVWGTRLTTALPAWRSVIGYVPQDIYLLDETLADNIRMGRSAGGRDMEVLHNALRAARLEGLVEGLADGIDTRIGERGALLSGGQRQRIGLARALYLEPRILLLDEATSALDNETEREIGQMLDELRGTTTTVTIAHRLSTVRACDRLIFLEKGRISGVGDFAELMSRNPGFAHLVSLGSLQDQ